MEAKKEKLTLFFNERKSKLFSCLMVWTGGSVGKVHDKLNMSCETISDL